MSTDTNAVPTVAIVNPTAGRGKAGKSVKAIRELLGQDAAHWTWCYTQARGDGERLAREAVADNAQLVVSIGGDGTFYEVTNGIWGSEATLGLIPFGTGNDLARSIGLFGSLETACRAVTHGITRHIDVGLIEGAGTNGPRRFLVISGTGYVADTARTVNQGVRFLSGAAAYVWGAIVTLKDFTPFTLTVETDTGESRTLKSMFIAVANTPVTGGGMLLAPEATVDDGYLDICLVSEISKPQLLYQLTQVFKGAHVKHPAVTMLRAKRVTIDADPPQILWIDGDTMGTTPATLSILPGALPIMVPVPKE